MFWDRKGGEGEEGEGEEEGGEEGRREGGWEGRRDGGRMVETRAELFSPSPRQQTRWLVSVTSSSQKKIHESD